MKLRKVYIKHHSGGAGKWIYEGYKRAWESLGHEVKYYSSLAEVDTEEEPYYLMAIDGDVNNAEAFTKVVASYKTFLYAQPNAFPHPWGSHPNFQSHCPPEFMDKLNESENVCLWSFGRGFEYYTKWKNVHYIPLAYDHIGYVPEKDSAYEFDVCFVGGWADNGFNEKMKIMVSHFEELKKLNLNLGISVNGGISDQEEANLLYNSKISINIHDEYQRVFGKDSNERTFKSLGLNGFLICDDILEVKNLFPTVPTAKTPKLFASLVKEYMDVALDDIKEKNRDDILKNHTYINRVNSLLEL